MVKLHFSGVRLTTRKNANLPHSVGQAKNALSPPPLGAGKNTKLPAHLRQVKQLSLTRLFSAESLGFPRSREGERALCLPKEQGRVCTLPCLREGSFTLQDGAHFWSLHPPPALNISSPTPGMFAISQSSFMPDFYLFVCITLYIYYKKTFCEK
ncbi:putative disease resistance protein [Trichinella spiralis]|uniref:Disease resistance protein n=1 Tax=Trichinella spiralis TaxID=6334 RepID=A0ABR3KUL4_TRISP